jgi:hypothetical protein
MARDIVGAIRKVTLDGITFNVFADANIKEVGSAWENSDIPTSGRTMRKMVKRSEKREGCVLACNGAERDILKELSERTTDYTMSYETAAGDVYRCTGWIDFEARETEENRAAITMWPRESWEAFLA